MDAELGAICWCRLSRVGRGTGARPFDPGFGASALSKRFLRAGSVDRWPCSWATTARGRFRLFMRSITPSSACRSAQSSGSKHHPVGAGTHQRLASRQPSAEGGVAMRVAVTLPKLTSEHGAGTRPVRSAFTASFVTAASIEGGSIRGTCARNDPSPRSRSGDDGELQQRSRPSAYLNKVQVNERDHQLAACRPSLGGLYIRWYGPACHRRTVG